MGSTVDAKCICGFQNDNLRIGGGMMNSQSVCHFPVYCKICQSLVTANLLSKTPECSKCKSIEVLAYDNQTLRKQTGKNVVASWNAGGKLGRKLILTDGKYFCPSCQKFSLIFSEGNILWD